MTRHYIINQPGTGYIVAQLEDEYNWCLSNRYVRNFGYRQSDAIEFRNDCNSGRIDERRINFLMDTYTPEPYQYLGKGILRKQERRRQDNGTDKAKE